MWSDSTVMALMQSKSPHHIFDTSVISVSYWGHNNCMSPCSTANTLLREALANGQHYHYHGAAGWMWVKWQGPVKLVWLRTASDKAK